MAWCEANDVDYVLGLAKNDRLVSEIEKELDQARQAFDDTGRPARVFKDFRYQTLDSWSRSRRVIGKAEHLAKGADPRFVVTSLPAEAFDAQSLYEKQYCARGDMENRIKEQQLCLFADRTSGLRRERTNCVCGSHRWLGRIGVFLPRCIKTLLLRSRFDDAVEA